MNKIIIFFGICDYFRLTLYFLLEFINFKIPFFNDVLNSIKIGSQEGHPIAYLFVFTALLLFISLMFSGYFLIRKNTVGAWLVYFQFPFRFFLVVPSVPLVFWIIKQFTINLFLLIPMFILIELIKLIIVIMWHITNKNKIKTVAF